MNIQFMGFVPKIKDDNGKWRKLELAPCLSDRHEQDECIADLRMKHGAGVRLTPRFSITK